MTDNFLKQYNRERKLRLQLVKMIVVMDELVQIVAKKRSDKIK